MGINGRAAGVRGLAGVYSISFAVCIHCVYRMLLDFNMQTLHDPVPHSGIVWYSVPTPTTKTRLSI